MPGAFSCPRCGALSQRSGECPSCRATLAGGAESETVVSPDEDRTVPAQRARAAERAPVVEPRAGEPATDHELAQEVRRARTDSSRVFGPFLLLSELGKGGMGVVHRAWDDRLRRVVALKTILPDASVSEEAILRFRREAEAVARLRHPSIVAVHEAGELAGKHYIAMEFVRGATLERRLHAKKGEEKLGLVRAIEAIRDVAQAVQHAHDQGVVHRDLKPQNIIIDDRGRPHVLDFGLARVRELGDPSKLTQTGAVLGTPAYMPPEQAGEGGLTDERADVYSLGATLYFVLTGKPPFEGATQLNVLAAVISKDPVPPSRLNARAAGDLETICLKCLEKEKEKRYESAGALAGDLERYLRGDPIAARPIGHVERGRRWIKRNRLLSSVLVLFAIALAGGAAFLALDRRERIRAEREEARKLAEEARARFSTRRPDAPADDVIALGLDSFQAAARVAALDDRDDAARAGAFEAACALARVAKELGQWSVATHALRRAGQLHVDDSLVAKLLDEVKADRVRVSREHEKTIKDLLEKARTGALEREGGFEDALIALASFREDQTVLLLSSALDELRAKLPKLDQGEDVLAKLACEALGRLGIRARAVDALGRFLDAETDQLRAARAGQALCRLGGEEAARHVLKAQDRLGYHEAYSHQVQPFLQLLGHAVAGGDLKTAAEYQERALMHDRRGATDAAIADLTRALELDPRAPAIWANRGMMRQVKGDMDGALADYTRALELEPRAVMNRIARGAARFRKGDLDGAIEDYTLAIQIDGKRVEAWNDRGVARLKKNDVKAALADFRRAVEVEPRDAMAWANRGQAEDALGDSEAAIADCSHAIELDPRCVGAWNTRASAKDAKGDRDGAISDMTRAIALDPRNAEMWFNRGVIKLRSQDPAGAIADLDRAIEIDARLAPAWRERGVAKDFKGDRDAALADLDRAIELDPKLADAWHTRGAVRWHKRDLEGARADFERFLEVAPKDPKVAEVRAWLEKHGR
ncbi:tetratricopeptide repeat protein [bacterium]|nr:tetratricopeptide repeat protein [bacterium]